ncbi:hypothetical protein [Peribacillus butanolivorans]
MANLSNQVYIYSLSTDEFFNEEERNIKLLKDRLHDMKLLSKQVEEIKVELNNLRKGYSRQMIIKKENPRSIKFLLYSDN